MALLVRGCHRKSQSFSVGDRCDRGTGPEARLGQATGQGACGQGARGQGAFTHQEGDVTMSQAAQAQSCSVVCWEQLLGSRTSCYIFSHFGSWFLNIAIITR